jgi:Asp-tRNA(Asn)/Glu-tRNA(Gln) amidotransferase A subunit family amidase
MCYAAIGTDTAGSVREPAALCGAVGLKPSYGLVSTEGIIPLSPSLDHAGPITRSVDDCAIVLDAITESDGHYVECLRREHQNWRVGIPRPFFCEELDPEVAAAVQTAINELKSFGCAIVDVEIHVDTDRTLQGAESYAFHREMIASSPELYNPETLRRLRSGENITDGQYRSALAELASLREEIGTIFENIDLLVTPTTPVPALRLSELTANPDLLRPAELLLLRNTRPVNVWGLPAISVPCGLTSAGLPIGLQIIGPSLRDDTVLQFAFAFEQLQKQKYVSI